MFPQQQQLNRYRLTYTQVAMKLIQFCQLIIESGSQIQAIYFYLLFLDSNFYLIRSIWIIRILYCARVKNWRWSWLVRLLRSSCLRSWSPSRRSYNFYSTVSRTYCPGLLWHSVFNACWTRSLFWSLIAQWKGENFWHSSIIQYDCT